MDPRVIFQGAPAPLREIPVNKFQSTPTAPEGLPTAPEGLPTAPQGMPTQKRRKCQPCSPALAHMALPEAGGAKAQPHNLALPHTALPQAGGAKAQPRIRNRPHRRKRNVTHYFPRIPHTPPIPAPPKRWPALPRGGQRLVTHYMNRPDYEAHKALVVAVCKKYIETANPCHKYLGSSHDDRVLYYHQDRIDFYAYEIASKKAIGTLEVTNGVLSEVEVKQFYRRRGIGTTLLRYASKQYKMGKRKLQVAWRTDYQIRETLSGERAALVNSASQNGVELEPVEIHSQSPRKRPR